MSKAAFFSDTLKVYCVTTPTEEINSVRSFDIFPNPNDGKFTLSAQFTQPARIQLKIANTLGQIVKCYESKLVVENFTETVDASELANGVYFILAGVNGKFIERKLVLSRN